jgi:mutual gliding-motility protein MglA
MSTVNIPGREIVAKIVYYGPALSGKTSSLQRIYRSVSPRYRGELVSLATSGDRTIFFDFLPIKVEKVNGFAVRLQLYTVPGQVYYNATRKVVLMGVDGVVFVADSRPEAIEDDLESFKNLTENLDEHGVNLERLPLVFQYNKRDLKSVVDIAELEASLNKRGAPAFPTSAKTGEGVIEALRSITRLVARDLNSRGILVPRKAKTKTEFAPGGSLGTAVSELEMAPPGPSEPKSDGAAVVDSNHAHAFSMQRLFPSGEARTLAASVESAIAAQDYARAVQSADSLLRSILSPLPGGDDATRTRLLGMHGHDYLRFARVVREPAAADEEDALFALHACVAAQLRADQLP